MVNKLFKVGTATGMAHGPAVLKLPTIRRSVIFSDWTPAVGAILRDAEPLATAYRRRHCLPSTPGTGSAQ
jgi:hypothetical protein